jgi:hypothetical protein
LTSRFSVRIGSSTAESVRQSYGRGGFVKHTWGRLYLLEMLFDQDGPLQCAPCRFAPRSTVDQLSLPTFLFLDTYEHLGKEVALQFLPRLAIFSNTDCSVQPQFAESATPISISLRASGESDYRENSRPCQLSTRVRSSSVISSKTSGGSYESDRKLLVVLDGDLMGL